MYESETGCGAGDKCLFPHDKVDEQPSMKPRKSNIPKRRESDDKNAVAILKSVCECTRFQGGKSRGKPDAESLGTTSKGTIHQVYATPSEYPGKRKDHRWEKNVKVPHQRSSYALKFEEQIP